LKIFTVLSASIHVFKMKAHMRTQHGCFRSPRHFAFYFAERFIFNF